MVHRVAAETSPAGLTCFLLNSNIEPAATPATLNLPLRLIYPS